MMRAHSIAVAALAAATSSACLLGEVRDISCAADDECPGGYFCDLPNAECRQASDTFGPPLLVVERIIDPNGDEVNTPFVKPGVRSSIALLPENTGGLPAEDVRLSFAELDCIAFDVDEDTEPDLVQPGTRSRIFVDVTPQALGCEGLTIVDWFLTYSGRETRGIFDMNVKE